MPAGLPPGAPALRPAVPAVSERHQGLWRTGARGGQR